jgi:Tfp pilus assembly protein FimT
MRAQLKPGFTTLETITVMIIFGTMAAVAGPKFYASYAAATSRTTADRLARGAELARATAVRLNRPAELHVDTVGKKFWVEVDTTVNMSGVKDTVGIVQDVRSTKVGMALSLNGSSAATAVVCFDVRGMRSTRSSCQSGAAIVVFRLDTHVDSVQVTSIGKVIR